jgi:hypothetical protein
VKGRDCKLRTCDLEKLLGVSRKNVYALGQCQTLALKEVRSFFRLLGCDLLLFSPLLVRKWDPGP